MQSLRPARTFVGRLCGTYMARRPTPTASAIGLRGGGPSRPPACPSMPSRRLAVTDAEGAAQQCRVVKDQRAWSRKIMLFGVSPAEGTRPLVGRRQSVTIFAPTRGPVEYSVCHDHHQS